MTDDPMTRTEGEGETLDMPEGMQAFSRGQVLGERYQVLEMLGRGGMGEVWQAFDLKLRVEVALKALRPEFFKSDRRLELLRQEVRAAREVMSPNVCRIFDLIEIEGRELVSMEYVDGATLLGVLQERGPLDLKEAQDIASQFLAGLEAIHRAGLVHRDVKPENIMLTRAGRVVVMDFGLARQEVEGGGSVSGTPAYMAPEQAAGQQLDARADVYAAGVVLAEMVSPDGIKSYESRQSVWKGVRSEPANLPDSPWAQVLKRAVAKDREGRFNTAHTLTRALEDVTLRVEGAEDLHPYPGLASFTEEDAEYFFGREAEVEQMWRKLDGPPRMLAIMGPSGAGKSSFIAAGLAANVPPGWAILRCTPGNSAIASLRGSLSPELTQQPELLRALMTDPDNPDVIVEGVAGWRKGTTGALIIVDQFEELFTLNPSNTQSALAELLRRFVLEADIHVLLAMRDDFAGSCNAYEPLRSIFQDMTFVDPPIGANLRRALIRPAQKCGYRFEDDELVEEMLAEVEGERGALPLLAFAAARLWEKRDRETGLLTRKAYHDIGGVGGALARHAEATVDRIGTEHIGVMRELFRNLVTAEGTRAVREWNELISVFDTTGVSKAGINPAPTKGLATAEEVLRELIDARLLTSYEVREEDQAPTRSVEIIHESLLANWPRLVRWQTQDTDAAQLRDQLRQAARTWNDQGRSDDTLWTGSAYREFAVWREGYPGGLTEEEEAFATSMTAHAKRRKRLRRVAVAASFAILLAVLAVVGSSRQQAIAEANRAEASKIVTLGQFVVNTDRTQALAYAIASLERRDTPEARRLALRALWAGPPAIVMPYLSPPGEPILTGANTPWGLAVSPDGRFIAAGHGEGVLRVLPRDGGQQVILQAFDEDQGLVAALDFSSDGRLLLGGATNAPGQIRLWNTDDWRLERTLQAPEAPENLMNSDGISKVYGLVQPDRSSVLMVTFQFDDGKEKGLGSWLLRQWPLDGRPSQLVGMVAGTVAPIAYPDLSRRLLATGANDLLHLHRLDALGREPPRIVGRQARRFGSGRVAAFDPSRERLVTYDDSGTLRVWPFDGDQQSPEREFNVPSLPQTYGVPAGAAFSPDGTWLAAGSNSSGWLWDLQGPARAQPLRLGIESSMMHWVAFTPDGRWLVTASTGVGHPYLLVLWPLSKSHRREITGRWGHQFHPDGSRYFKVVSDETGLDALLSLPLTNGAGFEPIVLLRDEKIGLIVTDPLGRFVIARTEQVFLKVPLDGSAPTRIELTFEEFVGQPRIDPTGCLLAGRPDLQGSPSPLIVTDIETGEQREPELPGEGGGNFFFDASGRLLVAQGGVLSRWDPETETVEVLFTDGAPYVTHFSDGRRVYIGKDADNLRSILDLEDGSRKPLSQAHQGPSYISFDPTLSIVATGHFGGEIRVGDPFSEDYHLLPSSESGVVWVEITPDGRWVESQAGNDAVHLWPMPDLTQRPFHTLPYEQFLTRLKALTNMRAVADDETPDGYRIEIDFNAYRGWKTVPTW